MPSVHLRFSLAPHGPGLVFGATGPAPEVVAIGSGAALGPIAMASTLRVGADPLGMEYAWSYRPAGVSIERVPAIGGVVTLSKMSSGLVLLYDNSVNRAPHAQDVATWQGARPQMRLCMSVYQRMATQSPQCGIANDGSASARATFSSRWGILTQRAQHAEVPAQTGMSVSAFAHTPHQQQWAGNRIAYLACWQRGRSIAAVIGDPWQQMTPMPRIREAVEWGIGRQSSNRWRADAGRGDPLRVISAAVWQNGRHVRPGLRPPPQPPDPWTGYVPPRGNAVHMVFRERAGTPHLLFGRFGPAPGSQAHIIIPVLRTYIVTNDISLTRTGNALLLQAITLSLFIDSDSWCWGFSASLPADQVDAVTPGGPGEPIELSAHVNGHTWLLLAERVQLEERFGMRRVHVAGRGIAAYLDEPYAPSTARSNAIARTAAQLASAALLVNGVPNGWETDFQLTDWILPAGAWSHTGSPIAALSRIAEAAGGYLQSSPAEQVIRMMHRYPTAPWEWQQQTPDYEIPSAMATTVSQEWAENPAYNAVWVSGETTGVVARVKRAGTAGDRHAEMVVDPLITAESVARQRGLEILSRGGRYTVVRLTTPIHNGVIYEVGAMVEYATPHGSSRGIVRANQIDCRIPQVRQTIEVECRG